MPLLLLLMSLACGTSGPAPTPSTPPVPTPTPTPTATPAPPRPLEGATITITGSGFRLDAASAAVWTLADLRVYQGARLTFINTDNVTHDVLSDPPHIHTDCPELNTAGFLVPGQSRSTDPLNRLTACGFHDHTNEGNPAFAGKVTIEAR